MKLFKRKKPEEVRSFKQRVEDFWRWFPGVAERFYETIEAGHCSDLTDETIAAVDNLGPGFAWVYGPGKEAGRHSLTISAEGVLSHQLLCNYWLAAAPELPHWDFHASRQRSRDARNFGLQIHDEDLKSEEVWIAAVPSDDDQKIDITAWHHLFAQLPEQAQYQILFLLLDEVLGEHGTQSLIGHIEIADHQLKDAMAIYELHDYATQVFAERGWTVQAPGETYTGFQLEPRNSNNPRQDSITLTTLYPDLLIQYIQGMGKMKQDLFAGTGAEAVYLAAPCGFFPEENTVEARGTFEDGIETALLENNAGIYLGGGMGTEHAYSDFLLFDGENSIELVRAAVAASGLPAGIELRYFAPEKRKQVLVF